VDHLTIFGTECYVHIPDQKRQKLDVKAVKGYLVGYCDNKDGYRIYVPAKDNVVLSIDVLFRDKVVSAVEEETKNNANHFEEIQLEQSK
jgi:hypothetical protein